MRARTETQNACERTKPASPNEQTVDVNRCAYRQRVDRTQIRQLNIVRAFTGVVLFQTAHLNLNINKVFRCTTSQV
jgi:hypothetical protein